ncbi:LPS glycosyltransferase [Penicillium hispanicum]|uniref:LPS glycosyltransferase n=1 Tax=Penicillium hispanicum TaxID=1080232 RepID=UPI002541764B|nr:LPS glycosyltransferase [Penicillium hispanicum]KAJ5591697.1 LPS glycosyltransferase [Penicillium hispanicum]
MPRFSTCLLLAVIVTNLFYFYTTKRNLARVEDFVAVNHEESSFVAEDRRTRRGSSADRNRGSLSPVNPVADESHAEPHLGDSLQNIANTTLGFERVFVISLKDRMDKRDALAVAASLTQIDLEWIDGVKLSDIPDRAYPSGWERDREKPNELAAWRAHMNALQTIVMNKISSALILEDDCDWDVTLRTQLQEFARGTRALQNSERNPRSPYGDNWRVLWLGHIGMIPQNQSVAYEIPDDPTVRPWDLRAENTWPDVADWPDLQQSRLIFDGAYGMGSLAYAVTYETARLILAKLSMGETDNAFDFGLGDVCNDDYEGFHFHCFTPHPPLLSFWRKAGPASGDSDIVDLGDDWHEAYSPSITYSVMLNANRLASGAKMVEAQWPDVEQQMIDPAHLEIPQGRLISFDESDL